MKKTIYIILSLSLFLMFMSCENKQTKTSKKETDKYYFIGENNSPQIIEAQKQPIKVEFNKKLSGIENLEVIKLGKISKNDFKEKTFPKRGAYKLIYNYKTYNAEYSNGKVILHNYKKYTKTKFSYVLVVIALLFFIIFLFLSKISHCNDGEISGLFFVIGFIMTVVSFIPMIAFGDNNMSENIILLGLSFIIFSIPLYISSKLSDNNNGIIPFIILLVIAGLSYWSGENVNFLLYNILIPAGGGYIISLFLKTK